MNLLDKIIEYLPLKSEPKARKNEVHSTGKTANIKRVHKSRKNKPVPSSKIKKASNRKRSVASKATKKNK